MKKLLFLTLLFCAVLSAQQSNRGGFFKKKEPAPVKEQTQSTQTEYFTPFLTASLEFREPSGNNALDAGEEGSIRLKINNIGKITAENCSFIIQQEPPNPNLFIQTAASIAKIQPGESVESSISLKATEFIRTSQTRLVIKIEEKKGFDLYPEKIMIIPTREFQPPILAIVDYGIEDQNRNMKIEKFEKVDVTVRVQNKGETPAENVRGTITLGENVLPLDILESYEIGTLRTGEYRDIKAIIATNARAKDVKLSVSVKDGTGKFAVNRDISLPFDVVQKKADEIILAKVEGAPVVVADAMLSKLDIAENIPLSSSPNRHGIAVIIGNKNYTSAPPVEFAGNDAIMMKNYVKQSLGYQDENILYFEDAKQSDLTALFGKEQNHKGKLYDFAKKGLSDIFVYYSGHGAPDTETKDGYLVPVDCDPNKVALNGFPIKTLYQNLDKLAAEKEPPKLTVVLDACFSGNSVAGNLLKDISPIYITVDRSALAYQSSALFTSAAGDQVSTWYRDKKQSLFTYFFLKGLKGEADFNKDGKVSTEELHQYVADEVNGVPYWCRRINSGRSQTPTFIGKDYLLRE